MEKGLTDTDYGVVTAEGVRGLNGNGEKYNNNLQKPSFRDPVLKYYSLTLLNRS